MFKTLKTLVVAAVCGGAVLSAHAQCNASSATGESSLLGKRYLAAGFGYEDINNSSAGFYGATLQFNLPVAAGFDVGVGVGHNWREGASNVHGEQVAVSATYFRECGAFRPFVRGTLGHAEITVGPADDDFQFYGVDLGVEYQISSRVSVAAYGSFDSTFESSDDHSWSGTVQLNYWVRSDIAVGGIFSLIEGGDVFYGVGAAWVF